MKAYQNKNPTAWKRRILAASVVATGISAIIPWGQIKVGHGDGNDLRKSRADPVAEPSDQLSFERGASPAAEPLPPIALAAPVGVSLPKVAPKRQQVERALPPPERIEALGPRRRLIAARVQSERVVPEISRQAPQSSFQEVADGVFQVGAGQAADTELSNGNVLQDRVVSRDARQEQSMALPSDRAPLESVQEIAGPIEGPTSGSAVAISQDSGRPAVDSSMVPASLDNPPEAGINPAAEPEVRADAPILASNVDNGTTPQANALTAPSVDVPDAAVTNIAEVGAGPAIAPKRASHQVSNGAPDVTAPAPNADVLRTTSEVPRLAETDLSLNDVAGDVSMLHSAQSGLQLAQSSLPVRINDVWVGNVPFVIDSRDQLSVSLAGLLDLVGPSMQQDRFRQLRSSRAASGYASFETLRKAGFTVQFDKATDSLTLSAQTGGTGPD
ncbi:MAG: hypothetical protein ABIM50_05790 [Novosphingobium sp.]